MGLASQSSQFCGLPSLEGGQLCCGFLTAGPEEVETACYRYGDSQSTSSSLASPEKWVFPSVHSRRVCRALGNFYFLLRWKQKEAGRQN